MLVSRYLDAAARRHPGRDAVVFDEKAISYAVLRNRAVALATALSELGTRGIRVGILCDNRPEYVESYYGVPSAAMVLTLINQRLSRNEIAHVLEHSGATILITESRYLPLVLDADGRPPPGLAHLLCLDAPAPRDGDPGDCRVLHYEELVGTFLATASDWPRTSLDDDDPAWLVYTSGTTGSPKGVTLSHRNLDAVVSNYLLGVPVRPGSGYLMPFPLCHVGGHLVFACAAVGARLVLQRSFDADEWVSLVGRHHVETSPLAPTMLAMLLQDGRDLVATRTLRTLIYGSSGIPAIVLRDAMARLDGVNFIGGYGMTETAGTVTWLDPEEHRRALSDSTEHVLASCGFPAPLVDVRIVDDDDAECPMGTWGEVTVRGDQVMVGYWDDPTATADVLRDGWLRTGDIGHFDGDGRLYIVDRKKDIVISGGENVSSVEVEQVIAELVDVVEAAVVGVPDPVWGQRVVAFVALADHHTIDETAIIAHCRTRLASFKKPSRVHFMAELPRNALGKVRKAQLRAEAVAASVA